MSSVMHSIDALLLLRSGYLGAALLVMVVFSISPLRARFLDYGPRTAQTQPTTGEKTRRGVAPTLHIANVLDAAAGLRVPHHWFTSFYATSTFLSLFWASQIVANAPSFQAIARSLPENIPSMTARQAIVVWAMMLAQGSRRLYECVALSRPSQSMMWAGHWLIGILFYVGTSMAVWVEAAPCLQNHTFSVKDGVLGAPDLKMFVGMMIFILASGFQHDCHAYLATLKDKKKSSSEKRTASGYLLPEHPAFNISMTPHYFAECLIYLSLAISAAPQGTWMNLTLSCALAFVVVNLGVTAHGTRQWYKRTFGPTSVEGRATMIPFIY